MLKSADLIVNYCKITNIVVGFPMAACQII